MPRYHSRIPGGLATFGGQITPYANYTSQYAKGFQYREMEKYSYPLPPTLFKLKLRTAAELRFSEIVNSYMSDKINANRVRYMIMSFRQMTFDNMNNIIPKDEYEVQKMTSYMMSRKNTEEYRQFVIRLWVQLLFRCESSTYAGHNMGAYEGKAQIATEEEFMSYLWFLISMSTFGAAVITGIYWYWKYGQAYEVGPAM